MTKQIVQTFVLLASLAVSRTVFAFICQPGGLQKQLTEMVTKIAVVDEDGRMTEEEYARAKGLPLEEIQNRFAATGTVRCGRFTASAQLTGDNSTITTAGHIFKDLKDCRFLSNPSWCTFTTFKGGEKISVEISELVGTGFKCPQTPRLADDWAVLKLKRPLVGIKPYRLPRDIESIGNRDLIVAVNGRNADFMRPSNTSVNSHPKTIEDCEAKRSYQTDDEIAWFESNCDSSESASGSGVLRVAEGGDVLLGITVANNETAEASRMAVLKESMNRGPYVERKWATGHVKVRSDFLRVLRANTRPNSDSPEF